MAGSCGQCSMWPTYNLGREHCCARYDFLPSIKRLKKSTLTAAAASARSLRFACVAPCVRLIMAAMQQGMVSPQQMQAALAAKQRAMAAMSASDRKVKLRSVLADAQTKFQQYVAKAAFYGIVPLALTLGTWSNDLEFRDLLSGVRIPLLD